jgi:hypothetical protein
MSWFVTVGAVWDRPAYRTHLVHTSVYASLIHYLKAAEALKSDSDGGAVVAKMKELPTDDTFFGRAHNALAFVLPAGLAGLAGATKAVVFQLASLTDVQWQMLGEVVLMTRVGGMGTVLGPVVGAAVIIAMQNYLKGVGEWVLVIQGLIFVVTVLLFRRGIVGEAAAWLTKKRQSKPTLP